MYKKLPQSNEIFSYYLPCKELSSFIAYYSVQHKAFSNIAPLFIPDLSGSIVINHTPRQIDMTLWGPFNLLTDIGDCSVTPVSRYFVEFQPGGLSRLIYPNCGDLLNQKIPLEIIDASLNRSLARLFENGAALKLLDAFFLGLLEKRKDTYANGRHILHALNDEGLSVKDLSAKTNYSERHLNRYINCFSGVTTKAYIKIKRLNKSLDMLKKTKHAIEHIAFDLGYYDASHFIHDFQSFLGISPMSYRKNMSGFYNETLKKF